MYYGAENQNLNFSEKTVCKKKGYGADKNCVLDANS